MFTVWTSTAEPPPICGSVFMDSSFVWFFQQLYRKTMQPGELKKLMQWHLKHNLLAFTKQSVKKRHSFSLALIGYTPRVKVKNTVDVSFCGTDKMVSILCNSAC